MKLSATEFEDFLMELVLNYFAQSMERDDVPLEDRGRLLVEQRRMLEAFRNGTVREPANPSRLGLGNIY